MTCILSSSDHALAYRSKFLEFPSIDVYLANHARVVLRGCPFFHLQKEQNMTILPLDPRQRRPGFPFQDDFFTLGAPVGPDQPNRREDVIRVETILGNTGHHDLSRTDGPVGY